MNVKIKNKFELNKIRKSGAVLHEVFKAIIPKVKAGISTRELDVLAEKQIRKRGAYPAFKGVRGIVPYPATLCIAVNEEVVHGIPNSRTLNDGDIIGIDCGAILQDYYSDSAVTLPVGETSPEAAKLMEITKLALHEGIKQCYPGNYLGDVSHAIQVTIEGAGYSVVKDLYGHGIGKNLHEDPPVHNYGIPGEGIELAARMVLAIEVMSCQFGDQTITKDDGWTVVTADGGLSAHFEDTIIVTRDGPENVTGQNPF